jgi:hypothetical protein
VTRGWSLRLRELGLGVLGLLALGCNLNTLGTGAETAGAADDDADSDDESDIPEDCGNGAIDPGEQCDGAALGGASCMALGWDHGALDCAIDCQFAVDDCANDPQPGPGELYSHCLENAGCPGLDGCLTLVDELDEVVDGFCTNFCMSDDECSAPTGGNAMPFCREASESTHCAIDCGGGLTCPDGMSCEPVDSGEELCF